MNKIIKEYAKVNERLQVEILKDANKRAFYLVNYSSFEWRYFKTKTHVGFSNGCFIKLISNKELFLDLDSIFDKTEFCPSFEKCLELPDNYSDLMDTKTEYKLDNSNKTVHVFKNTVSNEEVWIDTKYLKYFVLNNVRFVSKNEHSRRNPVYIFDGDNLEGVILPVNHKWGFCINRIALSEGGANMSKFEILCNEYRENKRLIEELENMNDTLKASIIALMGNNETMIEGSTKAVYKAIVSNRFDSTEFKKVYPDLYKEYSRETSYKRFTVA